MKITQNRKNIIPGLPDTTNIADPQLRLFLDRIKQSINGLYEQISVTADIDQLSAALMKNNTFRKSLEKTISVTGQKKTEEIVAEYVEEETRKLSGGTGSVVNTVTFSVYAPYKWCRDGIEAVWTESRNPPAGSLYFSGSTVSGNFDASVDYNDARIILSAGTVSATSTAEYIIPETENHHYWRNEASDGAATYIPVTVMQCLHPRGLLPTTENRLYRRSGEAVGEGYPVVIYPKACETDTPTVTQLWEFSAKALAIRGGTFQYQVLTIGNYIANSHYELQPYLIDTGRTVTTTFDDGVDVYTTVWYEMSSFPGAAYSMSCYVPDHAHTGETTRVVSAYLTAPQTDEYGNIINDDPIAVRCSEFLTFQYNDLYYIAGMVDTPTGYVFSDITVAEAWERTPCLGGGTIYTRNADGDRDLNTAYGFPDFSGSTINITAHGTGTHIIVSVAGGTYYNAQIPEA